MNLTTRQQEQIEWYLGGHTVKTKEYEFYQGRYDLIFNWKHQDKEYSFTSEMGERNPHISYHSYGKDGEGDLGNIKKGYQVLKRVVGEVLEKVNNYTNN